MTLPLRTVADFGPTSERHLWRRVARRGADDCWEWLGRKTSTGYGEFTYTSRTGKTKHIRAHRAVYELLVGEIAPGRYLDHTCANRGCVNPGHLREVTARENNHHVLTRRTGGRDVRIPDAVWNAAEAAALSRGEDLSTLLLAYLTHLAVSPWGQLMAPNGHERH